MASHNPGNPPEMNDQAILRAVLPSNGPKRLARIISAPVETARHFFYKHLSASRRREVALALLAELDEQDRLRAAVRGQLLEMVGRNDEVARARGGAAVGEDRRAKASPKTR